MEPTWFGTEPRLNRTVIAIMLLLKTKLGNCKVGIEGTNTNLELPAPPPNPSSWFSPGFSEIPTTFHIPLPNSITDPLRLAWKNKPLSSHHYDRKPILT